MPTQRKNHISKTARLHRKKIRSYLKNENLCLVLGTLDLEFLRAIIKHTLSGLNTETYWNAEIYQVGEPPLAWCTVHRQWWRQSFFGATEEQAETRINNLECLGFIHTTIAGCSAICIDTQRIDVALEDASNYLHLKGGSK